MSTCDCTPSTALPSSLHLRFQILGVIAFVLGGITFGLGVAYYNGPEFQHSVDYNGAWWIPVIAFPGIVSALFPYNRGTGIAVAVFSLWGFLAGIVGCALDGYTIGVVNKLVACINKDGESWTWPRFDGQGDAIDAVSCWLEWGKEYDLVCVRDEGSACYNINGVTNGNVLKGHWHKILQAGLAFDCALTLVLLTLFIVACDGLCCTKKYAPATKDAAPEFTADAAVPAPTPV